MAEMREFQGANGRAGLYDDRLVWIPFKSINMRLHGGGDERSVLFSELSAVEYQAPSLLGAGELRIYLKNPHLDGILIAFAFFGAGKKEDFIELKSILDKKISEVQKGSAPNTPIVDNLAQIEKLAELLKSGVITQEEFNAKKKQLLGL
jgi:hypothetical protein